MFINQLRYTVVALLLVSSTGFAKITATQINREIQKSGATWVAKDTWVSQLPQADVKRLMGVQLESARGVDFSVADQGTRANLPAVLDWRDKEGKNWVSPMLNQANCGSCVAFAAVGVMETQYRIASTFPWFNIRLSTQNLFACGGGGCNYGWQPASAARFLQNTGVPDESCMPYTSGATGKDVSCKASCADTKQRLMKISGYKKPTSWVKNVEAIKEALQKGPLVTTLTVYTDFMSYSEGVYKHVTGKAEGGHAISIVGYDDNLQAFIIRNSWGTDWGMGGFGYVAYSDKSGVGDDTWLYEIPSMAGAVSVESPVDYSYFSGSIPFKASSTFNNTNSIDIKVTEESTGRAVWSGVCTAMSSSTCAQDIAIAGFKDGKYEIQAVALNANGQALGTSTYQTFYVANQAPELSLAFKGLNNLDLTKPVKGRIEFDIQAKSSSVPMSGLEFHYVGADGVDHKKSADVVIDGMTMGWRTNTVPNGEYQIWMVGKVNTNNSETTVQTEKMTVTVKN